MVLYFIAGLLIGGLLGIARGYFIGHKSFVQEDFHKKYFPLTEDEVNDINNLNPKKIIFLYDNNQSEPFVHCIDSKGEKIDVTDYKKYD